MSLPLEVRGTGGGCEAYVAVLPNGWEVVVTDHDDPSLPDLGSTEVDVGIYSDSEWRPEGSIAFETVGILRPARLTDRDHLKRICEAIAYKVASKYYDFTVACELCGTATNMTATKRCDRCWELETRIHADPDLARRILDAITPCHATIPGGGFAEVSFCSLPKGHEGGHQS